MFLFLQKNINLFIKKIISQPTHTHKKMSDSNANASTAPACADKCTVKYFGMNYSVQTWVLIAAGVGLALGVVLQSKARVGAPLGLQ